MKITKVEETGSIKKATTNGEGNDVHTNLPTKGQTNNLFLRLAKIVFLSEDS